MFVSDEAELTQSSAYFLPQIFYHSFPSFLKIFVQIAEEGKDRKIGTEISHTRAPISDFSVHIFLSDSSSSSNGVFEP